MKKRERERERETRPIPPLKRVEIRGSNKKTKKISKCESISSLSPEHFTFHKIGIWLSTNLLRTTLWLGNTGNQGMLFLPKTTQVALE